MKGNTPLTGASILTGRWHHAAGGNRLASAVRLTLLLLTGLIAGVSAVACFGESSPAVTVSAGLVHTCGIRADGSVECWGSGRSGQAQALGGEFRAVSAGLFHTCGVRTDGRIDCWGSNEGGQAQPPGGWF